MGWIVLTSSPNPVSPETFYVDTSVLLNTVKGFGNPEETRTAREFMEDVTNGVIHGIISTWVIIEMIHVIRDQLVHNGLTLYKTIEQEVNKIINKIFKFENLGIVSGNEAEMKLIGQKPPEMFRVLKASLSDLRRSEYSVEDDPKRGRVLNGIGGNDALHIAIALSFKCDVLATCDKGFWYDDHQISIYDVKNKVRR